MTEVLLADLQSPDPQAPFFQSLCTTGFAVLSNHGLDEALISAVLAEWTEFFSSSEKIKNQYLFKRDYKIAQNGFFPIEVGEVAKGSHLKDCKEFFHAYPHSPLPEGMTKATWELRAQLVNLAKRLLFWIEQSLPDRIRQTLSLPLSEMVCENEQTLFRILHYPPVDGSSDPVAIRAAAHEDINLITLLIAATQPGLQVKDSQGNWRDIPCEKNHIIVNVGDMLQECTQGFLRSTTHRVINPPDKQSNLSRYSFPLFLHPKDGVILSKRYSAKSYRDERLGELGLL